MARLPTVESFGARPTPRSARGVVSTRADTVANAEADAHRQDAAGYGDAAVAVGNWAEGYERQKLAKARSAFLIGKVELDAEFAQDQEFETSEARYAERIAKLKTETSGGLLGKWARDFESQTDLDVANGIANNGVDAFGKRQTHNLADLAGILDENRTAMLKAPDAATRARLLEQSKNAITSMVEQGFMDEVVGEKLGRETAVDYAYTTASMLPSSELFERLGIDENWSENDKMPPREPDGTIFDFLDEEKRRELAIKALPNMNATVAFRTSEELMEQHPGDIAKQIEVAKKTITNQAVLSETIRLMKADYDLRNVLDAEALGQETQDYVDGVFKAFPDNPRARLDSIMDIIDDEARAAALKLMKSRNEQDKYFKDEEESVLVGDAWAIVNETKSMDTIPPETMVLIKRDKKTYDELVKYARTLLEEKEPVHISAQWTAFNAEATRVGLQNMDVNTYARDYRNSLDNYHYDLGLGMILSSQTAVNKKAESEAARLLREAEAARKRNVSYAQANQAAAAIIEAKMLDDKDEGDAETIRRIEKALTLYVEDYVADNDGALPDRSELDKYASDLVLKGFIDENWAVDDKARRVDVLGTDAMADFYLDTDEKQLPFIAESAGLSVADLEEVIKSLDRMDVPVTLKSIAKFWKKAQGFTEDE
jgi:hypothetical protein